MSPPGPEAVDAALAALTGNVGEEKPQNDLDRDSPAPEACHGGQGPRRPMAGDRPRRWALSGKACKADMKRLARDTQRDLLLARRNG